MNARALVKASELERGMLINGWDQVMTTTILNGRIMVYSLTNIFFFDPDETVVVVDYHGV